jgi:hypothetical protein
MKNVDQKSLCTSKGNNIYKQFIAYLKEEERNFDPKIKSTIPRNLEKHHILPLHAGGKWPNCFMYV